MDKTSQHRFVKCLLNLVGGPGGGEERGGEEGPDEADQREQRGRHHHPRQEDRGRPREVRRGQNGHL